MLHSPIACTGSTNWCEMLSAGVVPWPGCASAAAVSVRITEQVVTDRTRVSRINRFLEGVARKRRVKGIPFGESLLCQETGEASGSLAKFSSSFNPMLWLFSG